MMEILPLAFDSMGARGMSCFVEVCNKSILVDPGVNLAPRRHKLPPHPMEEEMKKEMWNRITLKSRESEIVILTHYHYDHLNPEGYDVFYGKTVFLKHPEDNLNYNQKRRAFLLIQDIKRKVRELQFADGKRFDFGNMRICFSPAVPHGMDLRRGCVIEFSVRTDSECFLFSSDIEGANLDNQIGFIIENNPDTLFLDGPAITFPRSRCHRICDIVEKTSAKVIVVDHHIMREPNWRDYIKKAIELARHKGTKIISAAEYAGEKENLLEARRQELYEKYPI